jgi:hypothetical protein
VDINDHLRLGENKQVIVALQRDWDPVVVNGVKILVKLATEISLFQTLRQDSRAHASVKETNPLLELVVEVLDSVIRMWCTTRDDGLGNFAGLD